MDLETRILIGTTMEKKGNMYMAAKVGAKGPKKCDEKTITSTLFMIAKLTPAPIRLDELSLGTSKNPVR